MTKVHLNFHPGVVVELMEDYYERLAKDPDTRFDSVMWEHALFVKPRDYGLYEEMVHTPFSVFESRYRALLENSNYKRRILDHE
jgi:hypothetical protein